MSVVYPLTFMSSEEHHAHIIENLDFYNRIISEHYHPSTKRRRVDDNDDRNQNKQKEIASLQEKLDSLEKTRQIELRTLSAQVAELGQFKSDATHLNQMVTELQEQNKELVRAKEMFEDATQLNELINKKNGVSVVHKGSCDEKYVEIILKEITNDNYYIDNSNGTQQMDIRIHRTDGSFTIGVECKDKDTVTKADIDKFRRDKLRNRFYRSIFISTNPIKHIADNDQVVIKNDELFIVTKDPVFLAATIKLYLCQLEATEPSKPDSMVFDGIQNTYQIWQSSKKQAVKMDKAMLELMGLHPEFEQKFLDKHLYIASKSCLNSKYKFN